MTPTTETPPPVIEAATYTQRVLHLLQLLARGHSPLLLTARSLHGFAEAGLSVAPDPRHLPAVLLDWLTEGTWQIRATIGTSTAGGLPAELTGLAALWKVEGECTEASGWRHRVTAAAQERIRTALASFSLPPGFLIDAGHEQWAFWPLAEPLHIPAGDVAPAVALQEALGQRLGSHLAARQSLVATYPIAGCIRSWNNNPVDHVDVHLSAPTGTTYTIEQLQAALALEAK